jgi:hypothetical protein
MDTERWFDDNFGYHYRDGRIYYFFDGKETFINNNRDLKYVYDHVLNLFYSSSESYLKRTQIIMIAIQIAIIVGLTNIWKYNSENRLKDILGVDLCGLSVFFALIGLFAGFMWLLSITKNHRHMELFRRHLREIEMHLSRSGIPLYMFTLEGWIFRGKKNSYTFVTGESFAGMKLGLMGIDKTVAILFISLWLGLAISIICHSIIFGVFVAIIAGSIIKYITCVIEKKRKKKETNITNNKVCYNLKEIIKQQAELLEKQDKRITQLEQKIWNYRK